MDEELINKYSKIGCPYILNQMEQTNKKENLKDVPKKRNTNLNEFFKSNEYEDIKNEYIDGKLQIEFSMKTNKIRKIIVDLSTGEIYDEDYNSLKLNDENNYQVYRVAILPQEIKKDLTVREYIETIKQNDNLKMFKHQITIDYNNDTYDILFGKNDVVILYGWDLTEEFKPESDDDFYNHKIISVNLSSE